MSAAKGGDASKEVSKSSTQDKTIKYNTLPPKTWGKDRPVKPTGNSYLDQVANAGVNVSKYENFNKQMFMVAQQHAAGNTQERIYDLTNKAKIQEPVSIKEEVTFKIEKMEDKPALITNHFEGDVKESSQHSLVTKANQGMFGQLLINFHNAFAGLDTDKMKGPGFAMVFAALCFVVPSSAFAATAAKVTTAGASVAATGNMTKLLKSVLCAGLAAVITVSFIHPIDVVKTRMQIAPKG